MIFDSHCHLNDENLYDHIDQVIEDAKKTGVAKFLVVGYDRKSSELAVEIANKYKECYAAIGIHPTEIFDLSEEDFEATLALVNNKKVVAIGEIGLDITGLKNQKKENFKNNILLDKLSSQTSINYLFLFTTENQIKTV